MFKQGVLASSKSQMEKKGLLLVDPVPCYLEQELQKRYSLARFWKIPSKTEFLIRNSQSFSAVVSNIGAYIDAELIDALPNLEIVSTFSVGLDKIDLDKCKQRGIPVTNTPGVLTDDVADIAIGLALAVLRKICVADAFLRRGLWKSFDFGLTTRFSGKSVGIIGLGRIGLAIAKRAEAFGCSISYHSRTRKDALPSYKYYSRVVDLAANSRVLFVACLLTDETRHIVNREVIDALGPSGVLVNIGRGGHVDEGELVCALAEGRLGGAGLDVYENEPEVPEKLFELQNVVLQSHVGSSTDETFRAMADLVLGNLEAHFEGKPLLTPVLM